MKIDYPDTDFQFPVTLPRTERNAIAVEGQQPDMQDVLNVLNELVRVVGAKDLKDAASILARVRSLETAPEVKKLNNIRFAQNFPGNTADERIRSAILSMPFGGVVDCRGMLGIQFIASTIILDRPIHLLLGKTQFVFTPGAQIRIITPGVRVSGLGQELTHLDASAGTSGNHVVSVEADDVVLEHVAVTGNRVAGGLANGIQIDGGDRVTVTKVTVRDANYGIQVHNSVGSRIVDCLVESPYRTGIWTDDGVHDILIEGNVILTPSVENAGSHGGIKITGEATTNVSIISNLVRESKNLGIGVNSKNGVMTRGVRVLRNVVDTPGSGPGGDSKEGISFTMADFDVSHNRVYNAKASGILVFGKCDNGIVSHNYVRNSVNHAVQVVCDDTGNGFLDGIMRAITIVGNVGHDDRSTPDQNFTVNIHRNGTGTIDPMFPLVVMGNVWNGNSDGTVGFSVAELQHRTIVLGNSVDVISNGTGTITSTGTAVAGSGTSFTTQLIPGMFIRSDGQVRKVQSITNDTALVVTSAFSPDVSGQSFQLAHDSKTVRMSVAAHTTPMILESDGNASQYIDMLRLRANGSGAQAPRMSLFSNAIRGLTIGNDGSFLTGYIDHDYEGATKLSVRLRGVEKAYANNDGYWNAVSGYLLGGTTVLDSNKNAFNLNSVAVGYVTAQSTWGVDVNRSLKGMRTRPQDETSYGVIEISNASNTRRLEFVYCGTSSAGGYGAAAGEAVINAGNGVLHLSTGDASRVKITNSLVELSVDMNLASGKVHKIAGTQVVAARITGWGSPTGTAARSGFATSTVTTEQLAERVKALIDDLRSHGLIGD